MIHYHGGPITPEDNAVFVWKARHAFVSFAHPGQINIAATVAQSFALDNGAFSFWKAGRPVDWPKFYTWVREWRTHPGFDFAVVPDVIAGSEAENDALAEQWPFPRHEGAVVWHINESLDRLRRLALTWPRVCIGSSGDYDVSKPSKFFPRVREAIHHVSDERGRPIAKLHGLRMLNPAIFSELPLSSADSTNIARNIKLDANWTRGRYLPKTQRGRAAVMLDRIEHFNGAENLVWKPEDF